MARTSNPTPSESQNKTKLDGTNYAIWARLMRSICPNRNRGWFLDNTVETLSAFKEMKKSLIAEEERQNNRADQQKTWVCRGREGSLPSQQSLLQKHRAGIVIPQSIQNTLFVPTARILVTSLVFLRNVVILTRLSTLLPIQRIHQGLVD